jgi:2-polyprenyl-3-methyl-5-hydroxy-6-metoxy-1,4-benzoquinol methylase
MLTQVVDNYTVLRELKIASMTPRGDSCAPRLMLPHIMEDNSAIVDVLDIGFGIGRLGRYIKEVPEIAHWAVDGVDAWEPNCNNYELFSKNIYRNIWYGLAQEIPSERMSKYKLICLLDVIEHLDIDTAKWLLRTLLTSMGEDALLLVSTPLFFQKQDHFQDEDFEEHLIGIPASSMMALIPTMYMVSIGLVGGFVFNKSSLDYISFFQPTSDKTFNQEKGLRIINSIRMESQIGVLYKVNYPSP